MTDNLKQENGLRSEKEAIMDKIVSCFTGTRPWELRHNINLIEEEVL
jgi:hypothetical protein